MTKSTVVFAAFLLAGESLTCTGSDNSSVSVPLRYRGSHLEETVGVKPDSFVGEAGIVVVTGCTLESISCLVEVIHRVWAGSRSQLGQLR